MRLWSFHPRYLDTKGLVAAWREGLLAQKVLESGTKGYRNNPQLDRFRNTGDASGCIGEFLACIADEAGRRGYRFDRGKIRMPLPAEFPRIPVASAQVAYERELLAVKLERRARERASMLPSGNEIDLNPVFRLVPGGIEAWERVREDIMKRTAQTDGAGERNDSVNQTAALSGGLCVY